MNWFRRRKKPTTYAGDLAVFGESRAAGQPHHPDCTRVRADRGENLDHSGACALVPGHSDLRKRGTYTIDRSVLAGNWVAVHEGQIIAIAPTAKEISDKVFGSGCPATAWYKARPEEVHLWGVMDDRGWVGSNCLFYARDQAEHWRNSWGHGTLVTRAGQHDPWRKV